MNEPLESILALAEPLLAAIRVVGGPEIRPDAARTLLDEQIRTFRAGAERARVSNADANDALYALAALADEIMLARPAARTAWLSRMLQLALFAENSAGDGFFVRLEAIRRDPSRARVLVVYYVVLALGFRGRYAGRDAARLELVESVHLDLVRAGVDADAPLAPRAIPPRARMAAAIDGRWVLAAAALACALAVGTWMLFALDLAVRVGGVLGG
jgi:type VI secretion system protein ImpK